MLACKYWGAMRWVSVYAMHSLAVLSKLVGEEGERLSPEADNPIRSLFYRLLRDEGVKYCEWK